MNYLRSVKYVFENPKWWMVCLVGALASVVPILGIIVYLGYLSLMLEKFHLTDSDKYDDFDFNQLNNYLMRGVWPFLAQLIISLVVTMISFVLFAIILIPFILLLINLDKSNMPLFIVSIIALFIIGMIIYFAMILVITLFTMPSIIAAALAGDLKYSLSVSYILDFIKKTWKEIILSTLFISLLYLAFIPICVIPFGFILVYFVIGPFLFVQWHFYWQIYEIYLSRDGSPIPIKDNPDGTVTALQ